MEEPQKINLSPQIPHWKYWGSMLILFIICGISGSILAYFLTGNHSGDFKEKSQIPEKTSNNNQNIENKSLEQKSTSSNLPDLSQSSLLEGRKKIDNATIKLQTIDKIADPKEGLTITTQSINELKQSQGILLSIKEQDSSYQDARSYISYAEESIKIAEEWKKFFIEKQNQLTLNNANIGQNKPTRKPLPELSIKDKRSFLSAMQNKTVALTFDDGPTREYTPQILEILRNNNIRATFFVVGKRVRENCDILRAIYQLGHEIGNHTDTHPYLTKISQNQQISEIKNTQDSINQCLGFEYPTTWFRAPYGDQDPNLLNIIHQLGLNSAQWTIDTHDWKKTSSSLSIQNMVQEKFNSGVILMHDGSKTNPNFQHPNENPSRQNTVNALQPMINSLKNRGFNFVNLSDSFK